MQQSYYPNSIAKIIINFVFNLKNRVRIAMQTESESPSGFH